ncbi:hypothetical protein P0082_11130 [Candidatus Haliotispira prima]|uniref:Uncharacterized protein n=1 Tax=Candidatus Haliotispira prima TaxID=3034016 RepID=A0ABY8MG91_9SPIO|nr:hypothetical protein P0082_11130 [Candidatus Haliotispira prima]
MPELLSVDWISEHYSEKNDKWLFVYKLNKEKEARLIFRGTGTRPVEPTGLSKAVISGATELPGDPVYRD